MNKIYLNDSDGKYRDELKQHLEAVSWITISE